MKESREVYRQRVRMPEVQVAGLSEAELQSALAYEVEPFSGIPSALAEIEYGNLGTDPRGLTLSLTRRRGVFRQDLQD